MSHLLNTMDTHFIAGHAGELGLRYVAHGEDWAELALDYKPELAVDVASGLLASGPIISLIDTACGTSIIARLNRIVAMATLDLRVDYVRAAPPGKSLIARATCYRLARNVAFVRCAAHDGDPDDPVAHSLATFFFTAD